MQKLSSVQSTCIVLWTRIVPTYNLFTAENPLGTAAENVIVSLRQCTWLPVKISAQRIGGSQECVVEVVCVSVPVCGE